MTRWRNALLLAAFALVALSVACGGGAVEEYAPADAQIAELQAQLESAQAGGEDSAELQEQIAALESELSAAGSGVGDVEYEFADEEMADAPAEPALEAGADTSVELDGEVAAGGSAFNLDAAQPTRLIVKDGFLTLLVDDVGVATADITRIAARYGGYIVSSQNITGQAERADTGEIKIAVASANFEAALIDLRAISREVIRESATGVDVTEEFVDLESRLLNLEVTAERLREFLADAESVDEALTINRELSAIEAEIEQTKGRMNFLQTRAAFSTITISLLTDANPTPTPTVTPTVTPTATPTVTPTPTATPTATPWTPGLEVAEAVYEQNLLIQNLVHGFTTGVVFIIVRLIPTVLIMAALASPVWVPAYLVWRRRRRQSVVEDEDEGKAESDQRPVG